MKRAGGGKQKGAQFERDICKRLSLWVTEGERDDIFWRSAMSGGRATIKHKQGEKATAHSGDISSTHWLGSFLTEAFSLECKTYADLGFTSSVTKRKGNIISFWDQTIRDAEVNGKLPMLIAKQLRQPIVLVIGEAGRKLLKLSKIPMLIPLGHLYPPSLERMDLYDFEEFIKEVDASVLEVVRIKKRRRILLCPIIKK